MLWSVHIKKRMEAVAKLMNKYGRLPDMWEELYLQEDDLSTEESVTFLRHCVTFLEIFIDVSQCNGSTFCTI